MAFLKKQKNNPEIQTEPQKTLISRATLSKENKPGDSVFPDFKLYYEATL